MSTEQALDRAPDTDPLACLQACPLLAHVPEARLARALGAMERCDFEAGAVLFARGDRAEALFLIASGTVRLTAPSGRSVALTAPHCGEEAAAGIVARAATAVATTTVCAWRIPREVLDDLAQAHKTLPSDAALALAAALSGEPLLPPRGSRPQPTAPAHIEVKHRIGWICAILLPLVTGSAVFAGDADVPTVLYTAIITVTITMWVFTLVDEFIPPLVGLVATLFTGLAPPSVALSGFASPTMVTLLGVFALSAVLSASGLTYRVMLRMLRGLPDRPAWHRAALMMGGIVLSPVTPSGNNRLSLMLPLYQDVVDGLRLPSRSAAATAMLAATFSGAVIFSPMLSTSKSSNLVALGMLPEQLQEDFLGLYWGVAAALAALLCTALPLLALRWLIPSEPTAPLRKDRLSAQLAMLGPMTSRERVALAGFALFLVGSATVSWHHLSSAWISGSVLVGLLASGVFTKTDFKKSLDWPMLFYLLGTDGLVEVMRHLGVDEVLAATATRLLPSGGGSLIGFVTLALVLVTLIRVALPITAAMLVSAVVLLPIAAAWQVHPWICVFTTIMFSELWFLPYQSSQWLQVVSNGVDGEVDVPLFMRHNLVVNGIRVAAVYASIIWWRWVGLA